jgi:hypothetical protein
LTLNGSRHGGSSKSKAKGNQSKREKRESLDRVSGRWTARRHGWVVKRQSKRKREKREKEKSHEGNDAKTPQKVLRLLKQSLLMLGGSAARLGRRKSKAEGEEGRE